LKKYLPHHLVHRCTNFVLDTAAHRVELVNVQLPHREAQLAMGATRLKVSFPASVRIFITKFFSLGINGNDFFYWDFVVTFFFFEKFLPSRYLSSAEK
jgi:hypothetical protein